MGDAYGTGIVEKLSQQELEENANKKKLSAIPPPNKKENVEV